MGANNICPGKKSEKNCHWRGGGNFVTFQYIEDVEFLSYCLLYYLYKYFAYHFTQMYSPSYNVFLYKDYI